jgi:superfamily II DNA or RNA helicase
MQDPDQSAPNFRPQANNARNDTLETVGKAPSTQMKFRWPWRPYQQRVLNAIDRHLSDDRLHIVAAPGAGKTVLGLEVFRKLGQPAVVFSPTRIIRDQWLERLRDFLPEDASRPDWLSKNIAEPAFFTSLTYQALHAFNKRNQTASNSTDNSSDAASDSDKADEADATADTAGSAPNTQELDMAAQVLKAAGVKTIILDEAHHLRASWWRALHALVEQIGEVKVVSLTGTPPYDVTPSEWHRYELLCGPIDEEIAIPELVYAKTIAEMLNPVVDQRYLITRSRYDGDKPEYHAIPTELAKLKQYRENFLVIWSRRMGGAKIIDTHRPDGAAIMRKIAARNKLEEFAHAVHRSDRWE